MSTGMRAKRAAEALVQEDTALQIILETALDAVAVMRTDGTLAGWNAVAEELFGWSADEVLNHNMADLIVPERYRADHQRGLRHYLATGEGPLLRRRVEITALKRSGEEFPIELSVSPLDRPDGRVFIGFLRDISRRRRALSTLEWQARQATLLHQVTALAAETSSVSDVLQLCLDAVCELTGWPVGHAYVPAEDGSLELVPTSIWHMNDPKFERLREATMNARFKPGAGLPGVIWKTKDVRWVEDINNTEANFPRHRFLENYEVGAAFGVPIMSGDLVIAVLEFFTDAQTERDPQVLLVARTFGEQVGRVLERRQVQQRQEMLVAELNHRVKNMLAVVMAIATHTSRGAQSVELFKKEFSARLVSLARGYSLLTSSEWKQTPIGDVVKEIVAPHIGAHELDVSGPAISLSARATLALSMILHELVTNAVKYGALSVAAGRIALNWNVAENDAVKEITLQWQESGLTGLKPPQHVTGFGTKLIETSMRQELGGRVETTYLPEGIHYVFCFPARN